MRRLAKAIVVGCILWGASAQANQGSQAHFRIGPISGQYKGFFDGEFFVPSAFDWEFETFYNYKKSYYFRFTLVLDNPESRPFYTYAGVGHKFYLNHTRGIPSDASDQRLSVRITNKVSYYVAPDLGVAQVITQSFGSTLQAVSSLLELGVHGGAVYMYNPNFGVEGQIGATYGYGFSSTAVNGTTLRGLVGVLYSF